jgi:hypothetical protein
MGLVYGFAPALAMSSLRLLVFDGFWLLFASATG